MNVEFNKRQEQVFEILEMLAVKARENKESFVFIGGSAVQSLLERPKRLSIDLDAYYSGNTGLLLDCLKPEFEISERKSRNEEQFKFFEAKKDNILVKIDLA
ncbi:MAG: hypothetical protein Q7R70_03945, partial [Candidatus Diapherotrites archaeon]|nr:hypothetical protein [Candidatus Diapherotrites archaeon]